MWTLMVLGFPSPSGSARARGNQVDKPSINIISGMTTGQISNRRDDLIYLRGAYRT